MQPRNVKIACLTLLAVACLVVTAERATAASARWYGGIAFGAGVGATHDDGARLEFGRGPMAAAVAIRGGRVMNDEWLLGLSLDAAGAGSGDVVILGPGNPFDPSPATTTHRVAVNHLHATATYRPGGRAYFARGGAGLAESFTEDWDAPGTPVRRTFGAGISAGLGLAPRISKGGRWSINADVLRGFYGKRTSWATTVTVGFESF